MLFDHSLSPKQLTSSQSWGGVSWGEFARPGLATPYSSSRYRGREQTISCSPETDMHTRSFNLVRSMSAPNPHSGPNNLGDEQSAALKGDAIRLALGFGRCLRVSSGEILTGLYIFHHVLGSSNRGLEKNAIRRHAPVISSSHDEALEALLGCCRWCAGILARDGRVTAAVFDFESA